MDIFRSKFFLEVQKLVYLDFQILGMIEFSEQTVYIGGSMTTAKKH